MSSREQFEAWYLENWGHTEDHHETLFERSPDDESEYYRFGVRMAHQAWQAATNAMEAKCAALAAENGFLKISESDLDLMCAEMSEDGWESVLTKTPATDAYLAEVRASAVDEVCLKISNAIVNCYQDEQIGLDAAATICGDLAAQLRQGVQS